jgi:hypothetical protein
MSGTQLACAPSVKSFEIDEPNEGLKLRWRVAAADAPTVGK